MALLLPILFAGVISFAFREDAPAAVPVVVERRAGHEALTAATARILGDETGLRVSIASPEEAERQLVSGKTALVVVPGPPPTYRFFRSGTEPRLARELVHSALQRSAVRADMISAVDEPRSGPGTRYIDFLFPGLLAATVMNLSFYGVGHPLVESRMRRLIKRLRGTPMRRSHYLLAPILVRMLAVVVETGVPLLPAHFLLHVPLRGSLLALVAVILLGSLVFSGIALVPAARARSTYVVTSLYNLIEIPLMLFSGVFFASERFPDWMQPVIEALPLTALLRCLRGVMIEGATLTQLLGPLLILSAWGVVSFVIAVKTFRWD